MKVELQQRIIRLLLTGFIFAAFAAMFAPFFTPLLMAALFGFALDRVVSKYAIRKSKRRFPTALILFLFFLLTSTPLVMVGYRIVGLSQQVASTKLENTPIYQSVSSLVSLVSKKLDHVFTKFNMNPLDGGLTDYLAKAGTWLLAYVGSLASSAPELILNLFVFSCALYFFLTEAKYIRATFARLRLLQERELDQIIEVIQRSSYSTLVASAAIGALQASIVALGGLIFGFREFFLTFVVTFFVSFVPVIGAAPVAFFLALISLVQGDYFSAVGLTVVAVVAGSVDNIVKPLVFASSAEDLNPIVSLLAIIGAVIVYGIPGLLLGPILMDLTLKIVPILFGEAED